MDTLQPLILDSLQLLLLGMGTVFVILVLLIVLITLVSRLVSGYDEEPVHALARKPVKASTTTPAVAQQDELVAVISAAISVYKKRHRQ